VDYANSNPGATINFAKGLHGVIELTSGELAIIQSTTLDGPGIGKLAVSGMDSSRVFHIGPGATVTISGLTIKHGLADSAAPHLAAFKGFGGGILNQGNLTLESVVVSHNRAIGDANQTIPLSGYLFTGAAGGGGVANLDTLTVADSKFKENEARGASWSSDLKAGRNTFPGAGFGGGLISVGNARATVTTSEFSGNLAQAGNNCDGTGPTNTDLAGNAGGGAIANCAFSPSGVKNVAILTVSGSRFKDNQAVGGDDNVSPLLPGHAIGGAIASHKFNGGAELNVSVCTFEHNRSMAGNHNVVTAPGQGNTRGVPNMAIGGAVFACGKGAISDGTFDHNEARGGEGMAGTTGIPITMNGGEGRGGGVGVSFAGSAVAVTNCTFKRNLAVGGQAGIGASGGDGRGGGAAIAGAGGAPAPTLTITGGSIDHNVAQGGAGDTSGPPSAGGDALGGGVFTIAETTTTLTAVPITHNRATGGKGKHGGSDGEGKGGGLVYLGKTTFDPLTITKNHASTSNPNVYP
jgi:hypothetical protein